jgi:hypothetical protein
VSGKASVEGYGNAAKAIISSPGWEPGMNLLVNYSDLDLSYVTGDDVKMFAQALYPYKERLGNGSWACVNTKPFDFGLGRMWEVFMQEYSNLDVRIFYNLEDAKRWLLGR